MSARDVSAGRTREAGAAVDPGRGRAAWCAIAAVALLAAGAPPARPAVPAAPGLGPLAQADTVWADSAEAESPPETILEEEGAFADSLVFEEFPVDGDEPAEQPQERVVYLPDLTFNRVDGWTVGGRIGCRPAVGWFPRFEARVSVATDRDHRGLYVLEIAQPVLPRRALVLGWQVRRDSDGHEGDDERVGAAENFLAALLFRFDYRDYVERQGTRLFAEARLWPWLGATLGWHDLEQRSLADSAPDAGTVFRRKSEWRPNPASEEGDLRAARLELTIDRRDDSASPRRGLWVRLETEATGPRLESDFTYTRHQAEARGWWPLSVDADLRGRVWAGTTGAGRLPFQEQFAVGGISTLRGHRYKESRGEHVFLASLEYGIRLWRGRQRSGVRADVRALAFVDVGRAWAGPAYDLARRRLLADAGLGVAFADGRARLYAARDLQDSDAPVLWTVRLASPF